MLWPSELPGIALKSIESGGDSRNREARSEAERVEMLTGSGLLLVMLVTQRNSKRLAVWKLLHTTVRIQLRLTERLMLSQF